ncbi:hypothetical protein [Catellatospora chokoriensis]|uniref:DUF4878 domain-containing protein n=1 Tax=Catellatospora chokoriensis TaxID=310353 RepID=A0A8J3NQ79_9ACTN|nr:hypothetical protein [Catellatospora chokoriensis]GIF88947.1 hypothetical protein Cch02nite_23910 [Catellatospora chokoriensis]
MADSAEPKERGLVPGLVIVVLLLCVGTPAWVLYRQWADPRTKAGMTEAATGYLDALRDADYPAAYRWVCASERQKYPLDQWTRYHVEPDIASYAITDVAITDLTEAPTSYTVDAEVRHADGRAQLWHYVLYDESDGWRICYETVIARPQQ